MKPSLRRGQPSAVEAEAMICGLCNGRCYDFAEQVPCPACAGTGSTASARDLIGRLRAPIRDSEVVVDYLRLEAADRLEELLTALQSRGIR